MKTSFEINWRDQKYLMEWFDETNFEDLDNVTQAYGFVFDKNGRICLVDCNRDRWTLPGGGPEPEDKTFEDTFIREVDEEADLDIKDIRRIGYFKITPLSKNCERKEVHYITRFIAEVEKINEQTIDPATGNINGRKFILPGEFVEITGWGESGEIQLRKALDAYKN